MGNSEAENRLKGKSIELGTDIAPRGEIFTPVLQNVSFSLGAGQKLSICGRTGS